MGRVIFLRGVEARTQRTNVRRDVDARLKERGTERMTFKAGILSSPVPSSFLPKAVCDLLICKWRGAFARQLRL